VVVGISYQPSTLDIAHKTSHMRFGLFILMVILAHPALSQESTWQELMASAIKLQEQGDTEGSLALFGDALKQVEITAGKSSYEYAHVLDNLGELYFAIGNYGKAISVYTEVVKIKSQDKGIGYAGSLNKLAMLHRRTGNYAEAEPLFKEAKELVAGLLGPDQPAYTPYLNNLAFIYKVRGNYTQAEPLYLESKAILEKAGYQRSADYALVLNNLALLYQTMGSFKKAELLYLEAIATITNVSGKSNQTYATFINNLALLYHALGNFQKAEPLALEAKDIRAMVLGKEHPDYGASLNNLAFMYTAAGFYPKAEPLYFEAMEIVARKSGKANPEYATIISNLGTLYRTMGNFAKAEPLLMEAKSIRASVFGKLHPEYAAALNNLGALYQDMGKLLKVGALFDEALEITGNSLGKEHPEYSTSLNNMAIFYQTVGDFASAEPLLQEAITINAKILGNAHPTYANALNNLAMLYVTMGNYSQAEAPLKQAVSIRGSALGKQHLDYTNSVNNLAGVYFEMGDYAKAEPLFKEVIAQKQQQIIRYLPYLSEKEKYDFYFSDQNSSIIFELFAINRFSQNPSILSDWYNLRLNTKGLLFNTSNKIRQQILKSNDQALIKKYNDWRAKKDFLAKVYPMSVTEKAKLEINEQMLESDVNTLEKELSLQSEKVAAKIVTPNIKWTDVRQKLKEGEAAIEIIRTKKKIETRYVPVYVALIVTPQTKNQPDIVVLENGDELEKKYSRYYRNAIKQKIKDQTSYGQYWQLIATKIKGAKKVYCSVDGIYSQISLGTLFNPATGKYLVDEIEIQVVTSTKDVVNQSAVQPGIKDATLFGYPNYNNSKTIAADTSRSVTLTVKAGEIKKDSAQRFLNGENINELPGTKVEIETIEGLLRKKGITITPYMFDAATESELKKVNNPQVLHMATHGFFLADLSNTVGGERGFMGMDKKRVVENPLLRSGLLFAGAKQAFAPNRTETSGEDGILTAYEAINLNLDQTDLVVLSACETGLGVTSNGEGVYGLQRAFQAAGAKSVLMSLWTVSDEATQKLMTLFYENWLNGKSPREAFRLAQLALREKYPEPYYWGAFVLVGN
jgi:CHAT domain-containing protein/Flp pilus assembly protein TadD